MALGTFGACRNYRRGGLLVWLLDVEVFGSFDDDHRTLSGVLNRKTHSQLNIDNS